MISECEFQPYREALLGGPLPEELPAPDLLTQWERRNAFIEEFAFAVPSDEALDAIAALSPLVEVGAGTGYWAELLARRGADIVCIGERDKDRPYNQHIGRYHHVKRCGNSGLSYLSRRNAFICWPPYEDDLGYRVATRLKRGGHLAYIGEGLGGCTADEQFFDYVSSEFDVENEISIPQWYGINDFLTIYRKK